MSDKRYLDWHGKQWRVQVRVPPSLHEAMGKKKLVQPLHTSSLADANRLKWAVVTKLKAIIHAAGKDTLDKSDSLTKEALRWRDDIAHEKPQTFDVIDIVTGDAVEAEEHMLPGLLIERAEEIEKERGRDAAKSFYRIAKGDETPITALIDLWLAERSDMKPRQHIDYRRAVTKFSEWATVSLEAVSKKVAGRYVSEEMIGKGRHPRTANKDISCLSSYWRWLIKRGHTEVNPWQGQSLSKKLARKSSKRPFTDDEITRLITGTNDAFLLDLMKIAALSGMRLEEIASLKVRDVAGDVFDIREAKTDAGIREVPIHSTLGSIVKRRVKDKDPEAFLFEEMGEARDGAKERGQIGTKRFITYRRRLGVDERTTPEQRQSNVDFHSFRRWFIASARNALQAGASGFDPWTIAEVVGHDTKGGDSDLQMTMGVYPGKQSRAAKIACVRAVKLLQGVEPN